MFAFVIRRLMALIIVVFIVLIIVFSLVHLVPGDPAVTLLGPGATEQQVDALRDQLGLNKPLVGQFLHYLSNVLHGNLGTSFSTGQPVANEIMARLPATIELAVSAVLVAIVIGIPVGVLSALRPNTIIDHIVRVVALTGISVPAFLSGLVLQLIFGIELGWLPVSGEISPFISERNITGFPILDGIITGNGAAIVSAIQHLVLPTIVLATFLGATIARYLRNTMLDTMGEDFVRTARAKGLRRGDVIVNHCVRNSLIPTVTIIGIQFADLLGGAVLTETVFAWPGIGQYIYNSITNRDFPAIQGCTLVFAVLFILTSLLVDLLYSVLDPRIRATLR